MITIEDLAAVRSAVAQRTDLKVEEVRVQTSSLYGPDRSNIIEILYSKEES